MVRTFFLDSRELSPEKRRAAELLVGQAVADDESLIVNITKSNVVQPAPQGAARTEALRRLLDRIDRTAQRAAHVPDAEIEAAIDEAVAYVRQNPR